MRNEVPFVSGAGNMRKWGVGLFCGCVRQANYWSDHNSGQDTEETRGFERQLLGRPATRSGQAIGETRWRVRVCVRVCT